MLVFASANGKFGFQKFHSARTNKSTSFSTNRKGDPVTLPFDMVPPAEKANIPEVTPEQRAENTRRMNEEDAIRNAM